MYSNVVLLVLGRSDEARQVEMAFSPVTANRQVKAGLPASTILNKRHFLLSAVNSSASKTNMTIVLGIVFCGVHQPLRHS